MTFAFEHPWYLVLLLLAPLVWIVGYRGLANLGGFRRAIVLILRTAVVALVVFAWRKCRWYTPATG